MFALIFATLWFYAGCGDASTDNTDQNLQAEQAEETPLPQFSDAGAALAEGNKLLDNGETGKAIEALNQAVKLDPDLAEAYFRLGIAYSLAEMRDQPVMEFEPEPEASPEGRKEETPKSNSVKAFERAADAYKKLIDANDEDHAAHYNLGRAYNKLNKDEDAARSLRRAVKLNPEDTEYQTELGAILNKLAKYHEAIAPLKKALELDPGNLRAEELLEDAEAGRKRIDFVPKKKEEKKPEAESEEEDADKPSPDTSPKPPRPPAEPAPAKPKPQPAPPKPTP